MRLKHFDLNLLVALDALLREKSVTRAAERVHISQPAMSSALGRLRECFGDPLLVRVGRGLELTAHANALVPPLREALLRISATLGTQATFEPASMQRTFVGIVPDFVAPWLAPGLLKRVTAQAIGVRLQFENWSEHGPERLSNGEIDFLVALDKPRLQGLERFAASLGGRELQRIRWICAVAADHPTVHDELTREQFLSLPHVYVRTPGASLPVDDAVRKQLGLKLDVRATTENVLEVPFMLPGTTLIAILPELLAARLVPGLSIKFFELPPALALQARINLFWHKRHEHDPGHGWLRGLILDAALGR